MRTGELLVAAGLVTEHLIQVGLSAQAEGANARLGDVLVGMGVVTQEALDGVIEQQTGMPLLDLREYPVSPGAVSRLPAAAGLMYGCLPVDTEGPHLIVAFAQRPSRDELAAVRFACGQPVLPFLATNASLLQTLVRRHYANPSTTFVSHAQIGRERYAAVTASVATPAGFFRYLVALAIGNNASDIHLRPQPDGTRKALLRVDGLFREVKDVLAKDAAGLIRHIETLAGIDFMNRTASKEGRLSIDYEERKVDLRVSVIAGADGDSVVMRVLDPIRFPTSLDNLALPKSQLNALKGILLRPHGLLIAVGPTGSGKTTTLYTMLQELHARNLHVVTAEDPVEYRLGGVNQFESRDFTTLLPKLLRHDPDVIMVGELRDEKTVAMALNAALTGHLVLTTLHANDSASTIHRLLGLGASLPVLTSCLAGVLSQRLVRLTCLACGGARCGECGHTGYLGQTLVAELAKPRQSLVRMTSTSSADEVSKQLEFLGGVTLDGSILEMARSGKTSWTEAASLIANPRLLPKDLRDSMGYSDENEMSGEVSFEAGN